MERLWERHGSVLGWEKGSNELIYINNQYTDCELIEMLSSNNHKNKLEPLEKVQFHKNICLYVVYKRGMVMYAHVCSLSIDRA